MDLYVTYSNEPGFPAAEQSVGEKQRHEPPGREQLKTKHSLSVVYNSRIHPKFNSRD